MWHKWIKSTTEGSTCAVLLCAESSVCLLNIQTLCTFHLHLNEPGAVQFEANTRGSCWKSLQHFQTRGNHSIILQQYRVFLETEPDFSRALIGGPSPLLSRFDQQEHNQVLGSQNRKKWCFRCVKGKGWKHDKTNSPRNWWEIRWGMKEGLNGACETLVVRKHPNLGNGEHLSQNRLQFTIRDKPRTQMGLKMA